MQMHRVLTTEARTIVTTVVEVAAMAMGVAVVPSGMCMCLATPLVLELLH
jgi:hypothetical protein